MRARPTKEAVDAVVARLLADLERMEQREERRVADGGEGMSELDGPHWSALGDVVGMGMQPDEDHHERTEEEDVAEIGALAIGWLARQRTTPEGANGR